MSVYKSILTHSLRHSVAGIQAHTTANQNEPIDCLVCRRGTLCFGHRVSILLLSKLIMIFLILMKLIFSSDEIARGYRAVLIDYVREYA